MELCVAAHGDGGEQLGSEAAGRKVVRGCGDESGEGGVFAGGPLELGNLWV
jgi:hypothetical protein